MPPAQAGLDNPPRTWLSAAWAYCLQKAGSAACTAVSPETENVAKKNTASNRSLFAKSSLPQPVLIPSTDSNIATRADKRRGHGTRPWGADFLAPFSLNAWRSV